MAGVRRSSLVLLLATAAAVGCSEESAPPGRLLDGSPAPTLPMRLEGVEPPVVSTRVQSYDLRENRQVPSIRSCLQQFEGFARPASPLVARIGVHAETMTFRDDAGRRLLGCDNSAGPREGDRRWCGAVSGRLYDGRLRDPRLSIASCETSEGQLVGFAWIQPDPNARYVAVEQSGYAEVYETAGDLPVRVATTSGVIVEESGARFEVTEHDTAGDLIREYELEARVAG